ncbi:DUF4160 domain-containing protein [Promicromonospora sp. NPDC057138]|uniref:DUF4160 domain-containing protein n=1 Tax=Promicromonospora sp. NPDC057138 TaxID=3346031 RepID=UPI0036429BFF
MVEQPSENGAGRTPRAPERRQIYTRNDWNAALAEHWLTADDVLERIGRLVVHVSDMQGPAGYDDEGFFISLVADGLKLEGGVSLHVYPLDHDPPHVHVKRQGKSEFKIDLRSGDVIGDHPKDLSSRDLKQIKATVLECSTALNDWWNKGRSVPLNPVEPG